MKKILEISEPVEKALVAVLDSALGYGRFQILDAVNLIRSSIKEAVDVPLEEKK